MEIKFRTYCGLAGDEHELLIAETSCGTKVSTLYNRMFFSSWSMRRAKKRLLKQILLLTS